MSARYTCPLTVVISGKSAHFNKLSVISMDQSKKSAHFNKLSFISMEQQMEKCSKSSESLL